MNSGLPAAIWARIQSSASRIWNRTSRPVTSEAMPAMSANVGALPAVMVTGPSYAPSETMIAAAASAASLREVHDTGPSAGTAMTPLSRHGPRSHCRLWV